MRGNIKGVLLKATKYMRDGDDGRPQNNFGQGPVRVFIILDTLFAFMAYCLYSSSKY